jgi:hypothetical protein
MPERRRSLGRDPFTRHQLTSRVSLRQQDKVTGADKVHRNYRRCDARYLRYLLISRDAAFNPLARLDPGDLDTRP